jgi:hypothetical protein
MDKDEMGKDEMGKIGKILAKENQMCKQCPWCTEWWVLTIAQEQKLESFHHKCA